MNRHMERRSAALCVSIIATLFCGLGDVESSTPPTVSTKTRVASFRLSDYLFGDYTNPNPPRDYINYLGEWVFDPVVVNNKANYIDKGNLILQCTIESFAEILSSGDYSLLLIQSHGGNTVIGVQIFGITGYPMGTLGLGTASWDCSTIQANGNNKETMLAEEKYQKLLYGVFDKQDAEVYLAIKYTQCDEIDNDNDGETDESDEHFDPKFDNNEDGVMDLYTSGCPGDGADNRYCGDIGGDNEPGVAGFDDDGDAFPGGGKYSDDEIYVTHFEEPVDPVNLPGIYREYPLLAVTRKFIENYAALDGTIVYAGSCLSMGMAELLRGLGCREFLGYVTTCAYSVHETNIPLWIGGMSSYMNVLPGESTNASPDRAYYQSTGSYEGFVYYLPYCSSPTDSTCEIRLYNPPRIIALQVNSSSGSPVYDYQYDAQEYPYTGFEYPNEMLLDQARQGRAVAGENASIEIKFSRPMAEVMVRLEQWDGDTPTFNLEVPGERVPSGPRGLYYTRQLHKNQGIAA